MKNRDSRPAQAAKLRRQAEAKLREHKEKAKVTPETKADAKEFVHELEVHQIELEMQNEELVQSRAQVEEGLRQYTELYDLAPLGYFSLARDGAIHRVNLAGAGLLGVGRGALIKRRFGLFVSVESRPAFSVFLEKVFESRKKESCEIAILKDGQETRWARIEATCTEDGQGCRAVVSDITEQKRNEEDIRFQANLLENASDAIIATDLKYNIQYWNKAAEKQYGRTASEVMGHPFEMFVDNDYLGSSLDVILQKISQHGYWKGEVTQNRSDGVRIAVSSTVSAVLNDLKQMSGFIAVNRDITETKKAEEALRKSEARYRLLAENVLDVIWVTDMNMRPTYLSPSITGLLGYSMEEAMARGMQESLTPASLKIAADAMASALGAEVRKQKGVVSMMNPLELEMVCKDGSMIWVTSKISFLYDSSGRLMETMGVMHDITERKKAEEALRHQEQRFRALIEHASDVILIVSAEGTIHYMSPSLRPVLGFNSEEAIGTSIRDYIQQEAIQPVADEFAKLVQNPGATMQTEIRIQHKDGTWRTLDGIATNLLHDPLVEGVVINYRDITERKRVEAALQHREQRFRAFIDNSSDGIALVDRNGSVLYNSPSIGRMLGYRTEDLEGLNMLTFVNPEDIQLVADSFAALLPNSGATARIEVRLQHKDSTWRTMEITATNLLHDSAVDGIVVNLRDITERKKAGEALRESEARYRLLAEHLSDVIWIMDTNFRHIYISPSVTHLQGYTVEEAMAQPLGENMTPASLETAMRIMAEEDARDHTGKYDPNRTVTVEVELYRKDGSTVWVENATTYLRDSNGRITGYLGVSRDITERRSARKELEQSVRKLEITLDGTIQAIALTSESRDRYTAGHQRRVAQLGCAIAREMGFTPDQIQAIRIAGLLHDIGKISVPQEILSKPGKISDIEFQLIKVHSQVGYDILKTVEFPWPIADIVVQHHERMNGSGYPSGIREDKLLIEARILGVADVVEAMTSHRPYRPPLGIEKALEEISCNSGILYDPNVVSACLGVFAKKGFKFED